MSLIQVKLFSSPSVSKPRFKGHAPIQKVLAKLCRDWDKYLEHYISVTRDLFHNHHPEFPWTKNERVLVSTFAASIMRSNKHALICEELPVEKKALTTKRGRCDLWAHIPAKGAVSSLSFYMEAKRFVKEREIDEIAKVLNGPFGIQRLFSDFAKGRAGRIDQRSAYSKLKGRRHTHLVIGMMCLPIKSSKVPLKKKPIEDAFNNVFSRTHFVGANKSRRLERFPTVGVCLSHPQCDSAMLVTFTVLGSSSDKLMV